MSQKITQPAYIRPNLPRPVEVRLQYADRDVVQTELFPGRTFVPKTLIFARDDSHAEDIVHLCREVFGKGNDFCKKINYQTKHPFTGKPAKGRELSKELCLSPSLRIAVTVDMIATGTDVKAKRWTNSLLSPANSLLIAGHRSISQNLPAWHGRLALGSLPLKCPGGTING